MMTTKRNVEYELNYFQRKIDDITAEINRLRPRELELESLLKQWPNSRPIKVDYEKTRLRIKRLIYDRNRYLWRINK